jgi:hypothetical protein
MTAVPKSHGDGHGWVAALRFITSGTDLGSTVWSIAKTGVRFLSLHTGLPALLVAAVLLVVGYRMLKRTARFVVEVAAIAGTLLVATELGWIRW